MNELTDAQKELYQITAASLKGAARRLFMARVAKTFGKRGQRQAARGLGWDRTVINRGMHELDSGVTVLDQYGARGRKPSEARLPQWLEDIQAIVDGQSQTDPSFEVRRRSGCGSIDWGIHYAVYKKACPKKGSRDGRDF